MGFGISDFGFEDKAARRASARFWTRRKALFLPMSGRNSPEAWPKDTCADSLACRAFCPSAPEDNPPASVTATHVANATGRSKGIFSPKFYTAAATVRLNNIR
ncbi:MAG: hypothetical protein HY897_10460, partial [Deltaproteobacteria bacterium]|nr:hypothetical protein [Deltaproteobacteria bacterium]